MKHKVAITAAVFTAAALGALVTSGCSEKDKALMGQVAKAVGNSCTMKLLTTDSCRKEGRVKTDIGYISYKIQLTREAE